MIFKSRLCRFNNKTILVSADCQIQNFAAIIQAINPGSDRFGPLQSYIVSTWSHCTQIKKKDYYKTYTLTNHSVSFRTGRNNTDTNNRQSICRTALMDVVHTGSGRKRFLSGCGHQSGSVCCTTTDRTGVHDTLKY